MNFVFEIWRQNINQYDTRNLKSNAEPKYSKCQVNNFILLGSSTWTCNTVDFLLVYI